ncbi:retrovirus-related pol polyprotein from transposon TNT 1-94 [Tanacetum coccineum]
MDIKSAFLNEKLKEEVYVKQPSGFKSSEFSDYVCKLDKALYKLKQVPRACSLVKTPMVPPNNLGPDLAGKPVNETSYRGMIGSLMYLTATRPDIQFSTALISKDIQTHTMLVVTWTEKALQVPVKYLVENWFVGVPRNNNQWLCLQLKLNMLLLLLDVVDHSLKEDIDIHFILTEYQLADMFTKPLDEPTFTRLKAALGMLNSD